MYFCCFISKSCLTLCDPVDCSPPGSSVHGISQARILEWVAILLCVKLEKSGSWLPGVLSLLRVSETSIDHPQQPRNRRQAEGYDVGDKSGWAVETHRDRSIFFLPGEEMSSKRSLAVRTGIEWSWGYGSSCTHMASGDRVNLENVELLRPCHFVSYALWSDPAWNF